jgi:hypothetical protein
MTVRRNAKPGEKVRYVGANIGYMPGIPMKDMDAEEWNALDGDLRENAIKAGLYQLGGPEEGAKELAEVKGEVPGVAAVEVKPEPAKTEAPKPEPAKTLRGDKDQKEG